MKYSNSEKKMAKLKLKGQNKVLKNSNTTNDLNDDKLDGNLKANI